MIDRDCTDNEVFVGIDYHQDSLQVCVLDGDGREVANCLTPSEWSAAAAVAHRCGRVRRAALEVGTGSAALAEALIEEVGWSVELAHPGYVARMKRSPDKSDFSDARLLADLTRVGYLPRVWLAPPAIRELRRLVRYRQQQADARRNTKLRIRGLLRDHRLRAPRAVTAWTGLWTDWLRQEALPSLPATSRWILERHLAQLGGVVEEIALVEQRLREVTAEDAVVARLLTEPGVGEITAWVLRAEIGRFDRFGNGKSLSRFCGLSPRNASSGARQADAGLIKAGSTLLRATLIELAHRLARWQPRWAQFKQRLRAAGKPGSVASAAVANRWVRGLYYRMTEDTEQENHGVVRRR